MRTLINTILVTAVVAASALSVQAQQLRIAIICAGAATLNNGSTVTIGQPFVGAMSAPAGGVTLTAGIIPAIQSTYDLLPSPITISPGAGMRNGVFGFSFQTDLGVNYVVEASTNLSIWTPILTNIATGSDQLIQDTNAWRYPRRFYRVLSW